MSGAGAVAAPWALRPGAARAAQTTRLFLFTDTYPFGLGEAFVAAELPYLLATGLRIHLVPTWRGAQDLEGPVRFVPHGVVVRTDIMQRLSQARRATLPRHIAALARGLWRQSQPASALAQEMAAVWRPNPRATYRNSLRLGRALAHAAMLSDVLQTCIDGPRGGDGLYAYWLGASALGAHWAYPKLPLVARAHGHDLFVQRHTGAYLPMQRLLVDALAALYCISNDGARYARARFSATPSKIKVMPLGVAASERRARASQDGVLRLISCARISAVKNLDRMVAALRHVQAPMHWTHIGDGPDKARLMRACAQLPQHVQTRFVGAVAHAQVEIHLTGGPVDLFVNTSQHEGRPVSIMEALRAALPVRAPNVGGIGEMLPGRWLFEPQATAGAIAHSLDAFAALPPGARQDEGQLARLLWATCASAQRNYSVFAQDISKQLR